MTRTVETYGLTVPGSPTQADIELMLAFNPRLQSASGFLGRYQHLRNAIDLLWNLPRRLEMERRKIPYDPRKHDAYIWNDWSELMMRAFCENRWRTITGPNACIAGETQILNPLTGESRTVEELYRKRITPVVMTLHGAEQADVPFVKGVAALYEVRLSDGARFTATSEHRVLTPHGYVRVGSLATGSRLFGFAHDLPVSNSGNGRLVRVLDARGSQRKAEDSQADCRRASRFCDERLPLSTGNVQSSFPSRADVPAHSLTSLRSDALARAVLHSRPKLQSDRPSSCRCDAVAHLASIASRLPGGAGTTSHGVDSFARDGRFPSGWLPPSPSAGPDYDCDSTFPVSQLGKQSCYKVHEITVTSIKCTRTDTFYDLCVPSAGHYFAEGTIHHNSWKTTSAALYHLCAWFAIPAETLIIVTSTSRDGLKARFWKELVKYYRMVGAPFGNLVQSEIALQTVKGSMEAGIFGVATGQDNDVEKAVSKILGRHNTFTYACVDEMQATNEGLVKGTVSLEAGAENFEFTGLGNAESELDPHGQMSEPLDGWGSISVESETWQTKTGICIHLDGLRSPRVLEGDDLYPGLLRQDQIDSTIKNYGEDSPEFWSKRRGFWAPQGVQRTVLSMAMITKGSARTKAVWQSGFTTIAALDPSFEGVDRCPLRFYKIGLVIEGVVALCFSELILIKVSVQDKEPIHYQIARKVGEECAARAVPATHIGIDSTGEGGGLGSIMVREIGTGIHMIEFGGRPSRDAISDTNPKPADQEYDRKVTELCMRFRNTVLDSQVREMDLDTAAEFCQRRYETKGNITRVETKTDMKARTRRSPDLMDNALVAHETARRLGLLTSVGLPHALSSMTQWRELARKYSVASDYLMGAS